MSGYFADCRKRGYYHYSSSDDESQPHDPNDDRNRPDRSKSDYYCQMCDSRMNSQQMWDAHIIGKRHLKNLKKGPGEMPSKVKSIPSSSRPKVADELEHTEDPIVGLSYISETNRHDPSVDPFYSCHLCQGTFTVFNIVEHLTSSKHRMNYLKKEDPGYAMLDTLHLSKTQLDALVVERAAIMEEMNGRGQMEVKIEKVHDRPLPLLAARSHYGFHRPKAESRLLHTQFPSQPSTSAAAAITSSAPAAPSVSKSATQKPAPSPKPQRELLPEELDWDIERDVKHFTPNQVKALCDGIVEDIQINAESYSDPQKLKTLEQCERVLRVQYHSSIYKSATPEQKKTFIKKLTTDAWKTQLAKDLDRHSSW